MQVEKVSKETQSLTWVEVQNNREHDDKAKCQVSVPSASSALIALSWFLLLSKTFPAHVSQMQALSPLKL
jgi:hypothetical protein